MKGRAGVKKSRGVVIKGSVLKKRNIKRENHIQEGNYLIPVKKIKF